MTKGVLYSYLYWIPLGNTLPPIQRMLHEVPFSHIWSKCAETLHEGWDARRWGWGRRERTRVRDLARIPKATKQIAFVQLSRLWLDVVAKKRRYHTRWYRLCHIISLLISKGLGESLRDVPLDTYSWYPSWSRCQRGLPLVDRVQFLC